VSLPLTDSQDYDLIVDDSRKIYKVQAKTVSYKNKSGKYSLSLSVKGGNRSSIGKIKPFDKTKVDLLFILTEDEKIYVIPSGSVPNTSITLCSKYLEFLK